jgi:hypothetical protein
MAGPLTATKAIDMARQTSASRHRLTTTLDTILLLTLTARTIVL